MIIRDPVHGDVEVHAHEGRLLDTCVLQRLRGIKQLGTASLVFPGAVHTRFEHSIGTMHMADRLMDAINRNATRDPRGCHTITDAERRVLRVAALLHDVTHIPFGHNIEDQTGLLPRHDRPERYDAMLGDTDLGEELRRQDLHEEVLAILTGKGEVPEFWRQMLSDTIDADLMDYLRRDAYHTGLELRYDDRVLTYFRVGRRDQRMFVDLEKNGMLREDSASELLRMLEIRYHFSERVYYHHAKVAAGALLARMVELALGAKAMDLATLQRCTDEQMLFRLAQLDLGNGEHTARLRRMGERFARRELPKRVLVLPFASNASMQDTLLERFFAPGQPQARFEWEAQMEAAARSAFGVDVDVLLYCPARRMQLKEARTLVRHPGAPELEPLNRLAGQLPRLRDLEACYPRLWKLYVLCSERDPERRRQLQRICLEALPAGCHNEFHL